MEDGYRQFILESEQRRLNERIEIISGIVPMQILKEGSKEMWFCNIAVKKFLKPKWFKRSLVVLIHEPKELKKKKGSSTAIVKLYDEDRYKYREMDLIAQGTVHLLFRFPLLGLGEIWNPGTIYDFDQFNIKGYKKTDAFRLRFHKQMKLQQQTSIWDGSKTIVEVPERDADGRIMRIPSIEYMGGD